jgi:hypothetical protein
VIPVEIMGREPVIVHRIAYDLAKDLHEGKRIPMRAYGKICSDWYGSTCPYWSQCYGKLSSQSSEDIGVIGLVREKGRKSGDKAIEISNANLTGYRFGAQVEEVVPEDVGIIRHPAPVVFDFDL